MSLPFMGGGKKILLKEKKKKHPATQSPSKHAVTGALSLSLLTLSERCQQSQPDAPPCLAAAATSIIYDGA